MQYARAIDAVEVGEISSRIGYDAATGVFTHKSAKASRYGRVRIGDVVIMKPDLGGYLRICIKGQVYKAHRLAWLLANGNCPPDKQIDHIDHDKTNNAISNLRLVSASENQRNRSPQRGSSRVLGVCFSATKNKWMAYYCRTMLGLFDTEAEAIEARKRANASQGFHANHGIELRG